jgi:hypothetical protein
VPPDRTAWHLVACMKDSLAELRHRSDILLAYAKGVRAEAEAARLRSAKCRAIAEAACASATVHRISAEAATYRNAEREQTPHPPL